MEQDVKCWCFKAEGKGSNVLTHSKERCWLNLPHLLDLGKLVLKFSITATVWILWGTDIELWVQEVYRGAMAIKDDGGCRSGRGTSDYDGDLTEHWPAQWGALDQRWRIRGAAHGAKMARPCPPDTARKWPLCWGVCVSVPSSGWSLSRWPPTTPVGPVSGSRIAPASVCLGFSTSGSPLGRDPFRLTAAAFHCAYWGKRCASLSYLLSCG